MSTAAFPSEKDGRQAVYFSNRLLKNEKILRKWAKSRDIGALRLYDRDIPEVPLAVDLYNGEGSGGTEKALVIALYERPYEKDEAEEAAWLGLMAGAASEALFVEPRRIFLKTRKRMKGLAQYGRQAEESVEATVRESGLRFRVNFSDYLDTGLFLDHRPARSVVRAIASGKRVLNLFSYTGSFSVYAAAGGAASVTSVDLSNTYLAWSRENFKLNGLDESVHSAERADVMAFLERSRQAGTRWDIIVADPPTFSNSTMARDDFDVNRDWPALLAGCASALAEDGLILFSTNSRQLKWDPERLALPWEDVSERSVPRDFRNRRIHRCWLAGELSRAPKQLWD
jgi:23S rRNA (cytosine1962-C5)-methyltransferase